MKSLNLKFSIIGFLGFVLATNVCFSQQGTIVINQDKKITTLLDAKKDMDKSDDALGRYKVQIYSGNRSTAESTQRDFNSNFTDWKASLEYEAPNFKIWVGNFKTRLEGESALRKIKNKFPNAFIFKPKKQG